MTARSISRETAGSAFAQPTGDLRVVRVLPDAHTFVADPAAPRKCLACTLRRGSGVHKYHAPALSGRPARRSTYRTSGTPYLATSRVWSA